FFTLYYLITGFHALHVLLGMVILGVVARYDSLANYETGAAFWHMVDLVWIVIFPVIYLLR
ncbi:MAG: cytochrome c oxidase subunit 3, partial [Hyphomicrobiales bacterium]|nr:cytochrome c oxidase subunit 3 [Hyphomicrobiales bacterium]